MPIINQFLREIKIWGESSIRKPIRKLNLLLPLLKLHFECQCLANYSLNANDWVLLTVFQQWIQITNDHTQSVTQNTAWILAEWIQWKWQPCHKAGTFPCATPFNAHSLVSDSHLRHIPLVTCIACRRDHNDIIWHMTYDIWHTCHTSWHTIVWISRQRNSHMSVMTQSWHVWHVSTWNSQGVLHHLITVL